MLSAHINLPKASKRGLGVCRGEKEEGSVEGKADYQLSHAKVASKEESDSAQTWYQSVLGA